VDELPDIGVDARVFGSRDEHARPACRCAAAGLKLKRVTKRAELLVGWSIGIEARVDELRAELEEAVADLDHASPVSVADPVGEQRVQPRLCRGVVEGVGGEHRVQSGHSSA